MVSQGRVVGDPLAVEMRAVVLQPPLRLSVVQGWRSRERPGRRTEPNSRRPPSEEVYVWVLEGLEEGLRQSHLRHLRGVAGRAGARGGRRARRRRRDDALRGPRWDVWLAGGGRGVLPPTDSRIGVTSSRIVVSDLCMKAAKSKITFFSRFSTWTQEPLWS